MAYIEKYGMLWQPGAADYNIELECFRNWRDTDQGGLGRYKHLKNAIKKLLPDLEWNDWFDLRCREFCNPDNWVIDASQRFLNINNVGCAAGGKTHNWVILGLFWWLADPLNSTFAFCSVQKQMIESRSWAVLHETLYQLPALPGHLINSRHILQCKKGDSKHAVTIMASAQGDTDKAVQRLAGTHPKRYMIVVDEASDTPEAIYQAVSNASKGCEEFVFATAGNAWSRMDPMGRCCEPVNGWASINEDTGIWKTKGVREWDIKPGVCLQFHGKRSPNVKAAKTIYPYLYTYENWKDAQGTEDTLKYWRMDAGFWAPEGLSNTVFEESMVVRVGGMEKFTWQTWSRGIGALDPAFGGDDAALYFGEIGDIEGGKQGVMVTEKVPIRLKEIADKPAEYQIAEQVIAACKARGVKPDDFGLDATGTGRGVAAVLKAEWSPLIKEVQFGGKCSDSPASAADPRPCREVYDRKVTELWYTVRELLLAGQLRGLPGAAVMQFCKRTYEQKGKIVLEKKEEMRQRLGRSPDDADAIAVMVEVARLGGLTPKSAVATRRDNLFMQRAMEANEVYLDTQLPDGSDNELMAWME